MGTSRPAALTLRHRRRGGLALVAGLALASLLTGIASAGGDCGLFRTFAFTLDAPASFSEPGVHVYQWHEEYLDETGTPVVEDGENQIETAEGAALYTGSVLLRLRSAWGWEADGSINTGVETINPAQDIRFYGTVFCEKGDPYCGQNRLSFRWQEAGSWTNWVEVSFEPVTSACTQFRRGVFERSYGAE
jgi:hypothetical protein